MLYKVRVMCSATQTRKLEKTLTAPGRARGRRRRQRIRNEGKRKPPWLQCGTKRNETIHICKGLSGHTHTHTVGTLTHIISNGNHNHNNSNRNSNNNNFLCVIWGIRTYVNEHYGPIPIPHPVIPIPGACIRNMFIIALQPVVRPGKKKKTLLVVVVPLMRHVAHAYFSTLSERFRVRNISIGIPVMVSVSPGGLWA